MSEYLKYTGVLLFPIILVLPFPPTVDSISLALAMFNLLILGYKQGSLKWLSWKSGGIWLLYFSIYIFLIDWITQIFRTSDFGFIWRESRVTLLLLPIIIAVTRSQIPRYFDWVQKSLVVGVLLYIVYSYVYVLIFYSFLSNRPFELDHYLVYVMYHYLPGAYHHSYLGLYFTMAIIISLFQFRESGKGIWPAIAILIFFSQILMGGKLSVVLSFLILGFWLLRLGFRKRPSGKYLWALTGILFSLALYYIVKIELYKSLDFSIQNRIDSWNCTFRIFLENWVAGIGNGHINKYLTGCIESDAISSHNQYLEEIANYGLFGFWLPAFLVYLLFRARGNYIYFGFVSIIIVLALSENILSLQRGILFFAFYNSINFFNSYLKHDSNMSFIHRSPSV
jgi:hypothetical protein